MIRLLSFLFFCLFVTISNGQISGVVVNESAEELAFATVYIQGTTEGVSTNINGQFILNPSTQGEHVLICQYLGYETQTKILNYNGGRKTINFTLRTESIIAPTVEIRANAEDPAYNIIRQAIKRRKYFLEKTQSYSCHSYIKGRFDVEEVPEAMLEVFIDGMNIFDVDSNGQGIVYLSESESSFHKAPPDKIKEIMHSSVISGFDNQFSFNNAMSMDFSIYDNQMNMIRNIVSPIGGSAMFYYNYKLLGTTIDEEGRLLNKIQIIPKSKRSPTFLGIIYVIEDLWAVPKAELVLDSDHAQQALIDSVRLVYASVEVEKDTWVDFQKNLWMRIKAFGFSASGGFNGVFNDFEMNPEFEDGFFNREIFAVEKGSNKKSEFYWDSIRPIPLTETEEINYETMDSLKVIRIKRQDSLVNNPPKFKAIDILTGYNRYYDRGRYQLEYSAISSPGFNTVQGFNLGTGLAIYTNPDSVHLPGWSTGIHGTYGLAEERFRGGAHYTRYSNNRSNFSWTVAFGRYIQQYREDLPMHPMANTVYSLLHENNYTKYFEKDALAIEIDVEWLNGISLRSFAEIGRRRALVNHSDYSWAKAEDNYLSNNPINPQNYSSAFEKNAHVTIGFQSHIVFDQKYISYPDRTFKFGSKYPSLSLSAAYDRNFEVDEHFIHLQGGVADNYDWNIAGDGGWNIVAGTFILDRPQYFTDYKHFDGNLTIFGSTPTYLHSFHLLPYYSNSTNDHYVEAHYQHHFRGFLLDKVPIIRKLKWNSTAGVNFLYTPEQKSYSELYVGIENIGVHIFRFLRVDAIFNFDNDGYIKSDFMIGLSLGDFISSSRSSRKIKTTF